MEPEDFALVGVVMLVMGFLMAALGGYFFSQVYFCAVNLTTCSLAPADAATRIGYAIPLLVFGSLLIIPGAIFTAAGHITAHLRPTETWEEESKDESPRPLLRVCVKCGHEVDPTASYCPKCGNQLSKS